MRFKEQISVHNSVAEEEKEALGQLDMGIGLSKEKKRKILAIVSYLTLTERVQY